jgi:hypothetical protein
MDFSGSGIYFSKVRHLAWGDHWLLTLCISWLLELYEHIVLLWLALCIVYLALVTVSFHGLDTCKVYAVGLYWWHCPWCGYWIAWLLAVCMVWLMTLRYCVFNGTVHSVLISIMHGVITDTVQNLITSTVQNVITSTLHSVYMNYAWCDYRHCAKCDY